MDAAKLQPGQRLTQEEYDSLCRKFEVIDSDESEEVAQVFETGAMYPSFFSVYKVGAYTYVILETGEEYHSILDGIGPITSNFSFEAVESELSGFPWYKYSNLRWEERKLIGETEATVNEIEYLSTLERFFVEITIEKVGVQFVLENYLGKFFLLTVYNTSGGQYQIYNSYNFDNIQGALKALNMSIGNYIKETLVSFR